ncbi:MAG: glycine cleavage system protein GcvH [Deltaproteobacteria bacterium]|nr:glycine cleavage system protein GcvH [Deltaproteobacteria bacterium]
MATSNIPSNVLYTSEHEWISTAAPWKIGVSDYAQNALGDLTYVELPSVGDHFEKGQEFGTLESTKSVSPLYMPASGTVKAVNEALNDAPELVNQDPYGKGWIIEIEAAESLDNLLDADAYGKFLETL